MSAPAPASPLPLALAWRYLRGRGSRLLSGTARAALLSNALGVMAMVIAMALMTGYREDLQRKLIGGNAAVIAYPLGPQSDLEPTERRRIEGIPGVTAVRQVAYGQGTLASAAAPQGVEVTLRGVERGAEQLGGAQVELSTGSDGVPRALLGAELAGELRAAPEEVLRLAALGLRHGRPWFTYQSLRVAGTFTTGFSEFDRSWVVVDRPLVDRLLGGQASADLYEIRAADPAAAPRIGAAARQVLGDRFLVTDWQELNRDLFAALRVQQRALFLVLGLIVVVSTFNVASTVVVLVRERMREIGALAAMGLPASALRGAFLCYGGLLGVAGTLLGAAAGVAASWALDRFQLIRFGPEVAAIYFISAVPFRVEPGDLVAVCGFALLVNLAACAAPALRAARVDPAAALRYE